MQKKKYSVRGYLVKRVLTRATRSTVVRVRLPSDEVNCPTCHAVSHTLRGPYARRPADVPSLGHRVRLEILERLSKPL